MKIGINASFLRKQNTGIGQVTTNFIDTLVILSGTDQQAAGLEFVLYLEEDADLALPDNFTKKVFLPLYKRDDLIRRIWWEKFSLPVLAKKDGCDFFVSLYQCPTVMPRDIKHIMVAHDIIPRFFPQYLNNMRKKLYQFLTEKSLQKMEKIVAVSHRTEKDLITELGIDAKKITVCYIDVAEIYKKEVEETQSLAVLKKYNLEKGYIYSGGGLEMRKNIQGVLEAYKILLEKYVYLDRIPKLVISGKLMPQLAPLVCDVQKAVKNLELEKHVVILDYVPQEDLPALYKNAVLFVYPSFYEGFGLPVLEAMNQGTPVVTSKTSSLPEVGVDSVLYCDEKNVEDVAMVMKNILMHDHLRTSLALKGRERATHFSWNIFTEKMLNIINSL